MRSRLLPALTAVLLLQLVPFGFARAEPAELCDAWVSFFVGATRQEIPYCANFDLDGPARSERRAVVVIHGTDRNADEYFRYLADAAAMTGGVAGTLVIAPQFLVEEDVEFHGLGTSATFWSGGWKIGNRSQSTLAHPRDERISSFAVLEEVLRRISGVAPQLQELVVVGHSAGGQFVQRFAAGNAVHDELAEAGVRYVVANPSSYVYLTPERAADASATEFAIPENTGCDTWYDDYRYGLDDLNAYMSAVGPDEIVIRYAARPVQVLLGENDDDPHAPYLDTSCAALLQGAHRRARGTIFGRHLRDALGDDVLVRHGFAIVPGIGHDGRRMFQSDCGLAVVFGQGDADTACEDVSGVSPPSVHAAPGREPFAFAGASPNPFNPRTVLRFVAAPGLEVEVEIFDAAGRRVLVRRIRTDTRGEASMLWDGKDAKGWRVASGVYRVLAHGGSRTVRGSVVLLK